MPAKPALYKHGTKTAYRKDVEDFKTEMISIYAVLGLCIIFALANLARFNMRQGWVVYLAAAQLVALPVCRTELAQTTLRLIVIHFKLHCKHLTMSLSRSSSVLSMDTAHFDRRTGLKRSHGCWDLTSIAVDTQLSVDVTLEVTTKLSSTSQQLPYTIQCTLTVWELRREIALLPALRDDAGEGSFKLYYDGQMLDDGRQLLSYG
ncbi:hypothetical protein HK104_002902, partial [Borealophlyctis nickersoniae]